MLGDGIQRGGTQVAERIGRIAASRRMQLHLSRLEIDEAHVALVDGDVADIPAQQLRRQTFVAKFGEDREIFRAGPAFPIIERHAVDVQARQEKSRAVAKRKMTHRTLDDDVGMRQMPGNERAVQPSQHMRVQLRAREI